MVMLPGVRNLLNLVADGYRHSSAIEANQLAQLRSVLETAYHAPHYREAMSRIGLRPSRMASLRELSRIPVLTRDQVRTGGTALVSKPVERAFADDTVDVFTTGSTGTPLRYTLTRSEQEQEWSSILYAFHKNGARLTDVCAILEVPTGVRGTRPFQRLGLASQLSIDLRDGSGAIAETLRRKRPEIIYSYPSALSLLATEELIPRPLGYRPRLVATHGEVLLPSTRTLLQDVFAAPVRDTYGSTECFRIAFECDFGRYHILPRAAIIETDVDTVAQDGSADLLLTSLTRRRMPLIRYRLGDRGTLAHDRCLCGSHFSALLSITGRCDDLLTMPSGRRLSPRAINVLERVNGLLEYQIMQTSSSSFTVRVVGTAAFGAESEAAIEQAIRRGCAPDLVSVVIERVTSLNRSPNGKLRAVISCT